MDSDYGVPRELSDLQKQRSLYQPELPPCLQVSFPLFFGLCFCLPVAAFFCFLPSLVFDWVENSAFSLCCVGFCGGSAGSSSMLCIPVGSGGFVGCSRV